MTDPHYTTLTVDEYMHMKAVILQLRGKLQRSRECLERNSIEQALTHLKDENDLQAENIKGDL